MQLPKKLWNTVQNILGTKMKNNDIEAIIRTNGKRTTDDQEKPEYLNNYFANVGKYLASNIKPSNIDQHTTDTDNPNSIYKTSYKTDETEYSTKK